MPLCPVTNRVANAPAESRPPRNPKRQSKRDQFFYGTRPKNCRWAKKPEISNAISSSAERGQKNADIRQIRYPRNQVANLVITSTERCHCRAAFGRSLVHPNSILDSQLALVLGQSTL